MNKVSNKKGKTDRKMPDGGQLMALIKGIAFAYGMTCIIFIAYAMLLTYTDISESYVSLVALICTTLSCILGGFKTARNMENGGLLWGILTSVLYIVLLMLINSLAGASDSEIIPRITMVVAGLCGGGIGGILGINKK